jgi:hypothetical protein
MHRRVALTGKEAMMAHHKRGRPKSTRAGCLLCKPHKRQGAPLRDRQRFNQFRRIRATDEQIAEAAAEAARRGHRVQTAQADPVGIRSRGNRSP